MEQTENGWTIVDKDTGLLTYEYEFVKDGTSTSFAVKMPDGKMMVISPGSKMPDGAFDDLQAVGDIGAVVAPNGFHHLGVPDWRRRFPEARFFAPPKAAARIRKKNADAGEFEPLSALQELLGDNIGVRESPATKCGETWAWVKTAAGPVWFVSDMMCNLETLPSKFVIRTLFRITGSAPGFRLFKLAMLAIIKDKKQALRTLSDDMKANPPSIIVPAHGVALHREGIADEAQALIAKAL